MTTTWLPPEKTVEQTQDGAFRRQPNHFRTRFGDGEGQLPVEAGRYRLIVGAGCGWSRRVLIIQRLLGLTGAISIGHVGGRGEDGWEFDVQPGGVDEVLGVPRLNDLYRCTDPTYTGRGTVPTVVDLSTGLVVSNDYHTLGTDLETVWAPLHSADAPDLYPVDLRQQIDVLNQQLFDDVNNGPYKVLFATSLDAARVAKGVFEARLAELDYRLASRRYLFGERLTDSDVRLFQTLASFDTGYRPSFPEELGAAAGIRDFSHLWAYARDLFSTPGFIDDREKTSLGILPGPDGRHRRGFGPGRSSDEAEDRQALWLEPHGRESLAGSWQASGPGGAGTYELWRPVGAS